MIDVHARDVVHDMVQKGKSFRHSEKKLVHSTPAQANCLFRTGRSNYSVLFDLFSRIITLSTIIYLKRQELQTLRTSVYKT